MQTSYVFVSALIDTATTSCDHSRWWCADTMQIVIYDKLKLALLSYVMRV